MSLGVVVALGTSNLWLVAWLVTFALALTVNRRVSIFEFPIGLAIMYGAILAASPTSNYGVVWIGVTLTIWYARHSLRPSNKYLYPIMAVAFVHIILSIWQYETGDIRIRGLASNASILGMAGLSYTPIGAVQLGLSLSRTSLIGLWLLAGMTAHKSIILSTVIATVVMFGVGYFVTPDRFGFNGIEPTITAAVDNRIDTFIGLEPGLPVHAGSTPIDNQIDTLDGDSTPITIGNDGWDWTGYGLGQYGIKTRVGLPHNVFVLTTYELGVFVVPFWIGLFMLWRQYSRSYRLLAIVFAVGMVNHEFIGRIEGIYMVVGLHVFTLLWKPRILGLSVLDRIWSR